MTIEEYKQKIQYEKERVESYIDYKFETPIYELFSLSEVKGPQGVRDLYEELFKIFQDKLVGLTELVLVLNIKIHQWYKKDDDLGHTYDELWKKTDAFALDTLKGQRLSYYLSTTD